MFWDATPDSLKDFVADPKEGSVHNRGCAVDIGLFHLKNGKIVKNCNNYQIYQNIF